jgi:hypothetical protein
MPSSSFSPNDYLVLRRTLAKEHRPALEFICLDDSALHGEVKFETSETLKDFKALHGTNGIKELLPLVLERFRAYTLASDE